MKRKILIFIFIILILNSTNLTADSIDDGNKQYEKNDYSVAFSMYDKAIKNNPNNPLAYINMGNTLFNLKEYEKTIQHYNVALDKIKTIPSNNRYSYLLAPLYYNLGIAYFNNGNLNESLESLKMSLKLNPDDTNAKYNWYAIKKLLQQEKNTANNEKEKDNSSNGERPQGNNNSSSSNEKERPILPNKETQERKAFLNEMKNREIMNRQNVNPKKEETLDKPFKLHNQKDW